MKLEFDEPQSSYTSGSRSAHAWTEAWVHAWAYGARHMSPCHSEDVTEIIEREGDEFVAIRSPDTAEHDPDYRELGRFPT